MEDSGWRIQDSGWRIQEVDSELKIEDSVLGGEIDDRGFSEFLPLESRILSPESFLLNPSS